MHASYDAVSFVTDQPVDPRRLVDVPQRAPRRPEGAYRIKGFVNFGVTGTGSGSCCTRWAATSVSRSPWPPGQSRHTALEDFIGSGLDRSALGRALGPACPEPAEGTR